MRKTSVFHVIIGLTVLSLLIIGSMLGCKDKKHIEAPITGPAAGSGTTGGGETQAIELFASPSDTITTTNDLQATAQIMALVKNSIGQPMPDGTAVYWQTTAGELSATTSTTSSGSATVTLTFPKAFNDCSVVTAQSGAAEATISICVNSVEATATPAPTATPSKTFMVNAANTTIAHLGTTTVTATALTNGQPDQGLQVTFSVSGGGSINPSGGATNATGQIAVTFTGNNPTPATTTTSTITATTSDGRTGTVTINVVNSTAPTPAPTATPIIDITLTSTTYSGNCATVNAVLNATVLRNSVPVTNIPVTFSVSFTPSLVTPSSCDVNPKNPILGVTTTNFSCSLALCGGFAFTNATITATASGKTAQVIIAVSP